MWSRSLIGIFTTLVLIGVVSYHPITVQAESTFWQFQSIDTMKYSRDPSRQFASDLEALQKLAESQVSDIAATGATHVGIATPYDEEFIPVLKTWVDAAKEQNLSVWFRGNLSGWEGWFGYPSLTRQEHTAKTVEFILAHPDLFAHGDIFSACPECENGGPGDPRQSGDVTGHRQFLISEHQAVNETFRSIGKNVDTRFNSMNGDVARVVMDPETTKALGGLVVIDHYVKTPAQLDADVTKIAQQSGGQVILGEMGAPIPDIHGNLSEQEQAKWVEQALRLMVRNPHLYGINYWTNLGGSTALWQESGAAKPVVDVLTAFFQPAVAQGRITNTLGRGIPGAKLSTESQVTVSQKNGEFSLPYLNNSEQVLVSAPDYESLTTSVQAIEQQAEVSLQPNSASVWYRLQLWFTNLLT